MPNLLRLLPFSFFLLLAHPLSAGEPSAPFAVIELFTSQGCSSCPPADHILNDIVRESRQENLRVYPLSMHVDYWDYLGWKDPFSDPEFTRRQQDYARRLGQDNIYTPEVVVNGRQGFGGYERARLRQLVKESLEENGIPIGLSLKEKSKDHALLQVKVGETVSAILNVALVERGVAVKVERGENAGSVLEHENVVRWFQSVDVPQIREINVPLPKDFQPARFAVIAYLQDPASWRVLGAEALEFKE